VSVAHISSKISKRRSMMDEVLMVIEPGTSHFKTGKCPRIASPSPARLEPVREQKEIPLFLYLPKEIILAVLYFLSARDLSNATEVCREWRLWANDESLWRRLCLEEIGDFLAATRNEDKSWREIYVHYALHPKFISCFEDTLRIFDKGISAKVKSEGWPGYKTALTSSCAESGVHFWRVQLRPKLLGWLSVIGVVNENVLKGKVDLNQSLDEMPGSYGYFYDGKVVHYRNGARSVTHGCGYGPGDVIMILLNLDKRRIVFYICSSNSTKMTHVSTFDDIQPGKYRLAVSLNYQDTEVILLENIPPPSEIISLDGCENFHKMNHTYD